jgi:RNA polymerase sigma-70 factor (ECF subfamily)
MGENEWLADRFEDHRTHLRAVAYRMLGSLTEADDAVQEAWLRVSRADSSLVENMRGWLTTVVARVCLNMLQSRKSKREEPLDFHVRDPILSRADGPGPEEEALLADSVGLALQVVLERLSPPERLAFVLHDVFGMPFEEIAPIVGRSPVAARQLASRARRRVQGAAPLPDADRSRQWEVVHAFLAAAREGDFEGLLTVLDPDVVLRADGGNQLPDVSRVLRGATAVASGALAYSGAARFAHPVLVNGTPGYIVLTPDGQPFAFGGFTVRNGKIVEMDILSDPERLSKLDLSFLDQE